MNNKQIAVAFVAMVNGTTKEYKTINGKNNLSVRVVGDTLALYSYSTPIAVYDGKKVVVNNTFLSSSTAKHQSYLRGLRVPTSTVYNFGYFCGNDYGVEGPAAYTCRELLEQAVNLYGWRRVKLTARNGRSYTRFELFKETPDTIKIPGCGETIIHRYTSEQAARDEAARLNNLAYGWSIYA